jgi:uncharacterized protein (DUF4213/DUF364 family)
MYPLESLLIDLLLRVVPRADLNAALGDPRTVAILLGALIAISGALLGTFLLLRGMALTSDAISHTVLLGIVVAFLVMTGVFGQQPDLSSPWLILGAAGAGVATVVLTELIYRSGLVKQDAALGLAAINSYVNAEAPLARAFGPPQTDRHAANIFDALRAQLRGRRVGVVGHFRGVESLREVCDLAIFELAPQEGDLPATACEYLLPSMEFVFLTGTTLLNKTLPRLLELCRGARVAITGPSTPMSPVLLARGAEWVAGTVILDPQAVFRRIREGGGHHDFADSETEMRFYARRDAVAGLRGVTG